MPSPTSYRPSCDTPAATVSDWRDQIGRYCAGNSRLAFAVALPLAAPLLLPCGGEGGGFNFVGPSSIGKTTLHHVAASVVGRPADAIKTCNATSNAFEAVAALHNDGALLLDELGEASADQIGGIVYKLAGGIGRGRADQHGDARARRQWRALFATTGETDLATMMKSAGKRAFAGQELRLCDIPADTGRHGVFEGLHGFTAPSAMADHLRAAAARIHGAVLREYLARLVAEMNDPAQRPARLHWLSECRQAFLRAAVPPAAAGQVIRAASRFALVASGGELATHYGITGWRAGEATEAALACFNAWLTRRGTCGQSEVEHLLRQVAAFFEAHGESRFAAMSASEKGRPTPNRVGFKRLIAIAGTESQLYEYFVLPGAFKEMVAGHDPRWAAAVLIERGLLRTQGDGKPQSLHRLPGMNSKRCYHFPPPPPEEGEEIDTQDDDENEPY